MQTLLSFLDIDFKNFWLLPNIEFELLKLYLKAIQTNTICSFSAPSEWYFSIAGYHERK